MAAMIVLFGIVAASLYLARDASAAPQPGLPQTGAPESAHVRIESSLQPGKFVSLKASKPRITGL